MGSEGLPKMREGGGGGLIFWEWDGLKNHCFGNERNLILAGSAALLFLVFPFSTKHSHMRMDCLCFRIALGIVQGKVAIRNMILFLLFLGYSWVAGTQSSRN